MITSSSTLTPEVCRIIARRIGLHDAARHASYLAEKWGSTNTKMATRWGHPGEYHEKVAALPPTTPEQRREFENLAASLGYTGSHLWNNPTEAANAVIKKYFSA